MRQGARTYKAECANCHGTTGSRIPTAPLDSADFLATRGDATLIANVNEGKGTMPAFGKGRGGPLGDEQVRSVVAFLNAQAGRSSVTELASAGEKLYMGNCARCHGEQGNRIPIAPLNAKGFLDTKTDADLVKIIDEGQGIMPGLAKDRGGPLSDRDITAVVSYLRYVVEAQVARTVSRGREIYVGQCLMCHGATGDRIPSVALASGANLNKIGDGAIISAINEGNGVMPAFGSGKGGALAITDIAALLAYLKASSGLSATAALTTLATKGTGGALYAQNCAKCHGQDGTSVPGVQLFSKEFQGRRGEALIKETITVGNVKGMPAWGQKAGGPLGDEQVQGIVDFLKAGAAPAAGGASPSTPAASKPSGGALVTPELVSKGKGLFTSNCAACHGETRDKIPTCKLADATWLKDRGHIELVRDITEGKPPIMPAWGKSKGGPLSDDDIKAVAAYIWDAAGLKESDAGGGGSGTASTGSASSGSSSSTSSASPYASVVAAAAKLPQGAQRGKELYNGICITCHGADGLARAPCPIGSKEWLSNTSEEGILVRIARGKTAMGMPAWSQKNGGPLSDDDILSVAAYLFEMAR
ncbi:MAG TPA: c-type cytochrome [Dehalococcoidia bacterium]|nr:c-type cytochrome [Dehalococcoidia bacterium]